MTIPLIVAAVGAALWFAVPQPKVADAGRWLFILGSAFALWVVTR